MNLLVIASMLPYPFDNGALARLFNLYSRLGKNHRITWVCPIWKGTEDHVAGAMQFCERVVELPRSDQRPLPTMGWRYLLLRAVAPFHWERLFVYCFGYVNSPGMYWIIQTPERLNLVKQLVAENQFDAILCEFEGNAELTPPSIQCPKLLMTHNVQSSIFKRRKVYGMSWEDRLFFWPEYLKVRGYEKKNYQNFNLAIAVSKEDKKELKSHVPDLPIEIIPNGVDVDFYQPSTKIPDQKNLVFIGNYTYPPNEDAALYFCQEILPLIQKSIHDITVTFVGKNPPHPITILHGVEATGFVDDIRPYLSRAAIVIVPIRAGGGTRLKILDALSMGKAIVSTSLGAEGIDVRHGEDILIADTPKDFADRVVELVENPELRKKLEVNGRELAKKKYDWDILAGNLDRYLHEVVDSYQQKRKGS
jgi:polysaccharide biosynthesis protein PslH